MASTSGWPNSYVRELHASVSTPRDVLASLTRRSTGGDLDQVERIVQGYDNEVYRIGTAQGDDIVIRIRRFGGTLHQARAEARMIEQARAAAVPVPEVLLLEMVTIDGDEFPVMVQRAVPGRPLTERYPILDAVQQRAVLAQVGVVIARLNGIPAPGDWAAATQAEVEKRRAERRLVLTAGFSPPTFDRMINALDHYVADFPCPEPVLCHGDLGPNHIYIDEVAGITGVIDFGDAHAGSPVHDLAVLRVRGAALDIEGVLSGYGAPRTLAFRRQLDLHTLLIALSSLGLGVGEDDDACVTRASTLIRRLLEDLHI